MSPQKSRVILSFLSFPLKKRVFTHSLILWYNKSAPLKKGGVAMGKILAWIVISTLSILVLPLLKDILFELWKENHSKDKSKEQD